MMSSTALIYGAPFLLGVILVEVCAAIFESLSGQFACRFTVKNQSSGTTTFSSKTQGVRGSQSMCKNDGHDVLGVPIHNYDR